MISAKWKKICKICSILVFILIPIILYYLKVIPIVNEDTLNIISLLVQSEASVIAIVITLSLVAVQLTSSSYSTRVIDIFKKSWSFRSVVLLYLAAIIIGLITLIFNYNGLSNNIQMLILIDYYLGIFVFLMLIYFIFTIFNLLKPNKMIDLLANNINKNNIIKTVEKPKIDRKIKSNDEFFNYYNLNLYKPKINSDKEPIQPIIDIMESSLLKNDFETFKHGLKVIEKKIDLILKEKMDKNDKEIILCLILTYLTRMGLITINMGDEESIHDLTTSIKFYGIKAIKEDCDYETVLAISSFNKIITSSIKNRLEYSTSISTMYLREMIEITIQFEKDTLDLTYRVLIKMVRGSLKKGLEDAIVWGIMSILLIAKSSFKKAKDLKKPTTIELLGEIGITSAKSSLVTSITASTNSLEKVAKINNNPRTIMKIVEYLVEICKITLNEKLNDSTRQSIFVLKDIGKYSIDKKFERESIKIGEFMAEMAKNSLNKDFEILTLVIVDDIKELCIKAVESADLNAIMEKSLGSGLIIHNQNFMNITEKWQNYNSMLVVNSILGSITNIGEETAKKGLNSSLTLVIINAIMEIYHSEISVNNGDSVIFELGRIGKISIEGDGYLSLKIVELIIKIIDENILKNRSMLFYDFYILTELCKPAMKNALKRKTFFDKIYIKIIESLIKYQKNLLEQENRHIGDILYTLGVIGVEAINLKYNHLLNQIFETIKDAGETCLKLDIKYGINETFHSIGMIGEAAIINGYINPTSRSINFIDKNENKIIENLKPLALSCVIDSLAKIGKKSIKEKIEGVSRNQLVNISKKCINSYAKIGTSLIKKISSNVQNKRDTKVEIDQLYNLLINLFNTGKLGIENSNYDVLNEIKNSFMQFSKCGEDNDLENLSSFITENFVKELEKLELENIPHIKSNFKTWN